MEALDTLVVDNVEAVELDDQKQILLMYQKFFNQYLDVVNKDLPSNAVRCTKVNIGTRSNDISIRDLDIVEKSIAGPDEDFHTDAEFQRVLLSLEN